MSLETRESHESQKDVTLRNHADAMISRGIKLYPDARNCFPYRLRRKSDNSDNEEERWQNYREIILAEPLLHYADRYRIRYQNSKEAVDYLLEKSDRDAVQEYDEIVDFINNELPSIVENRDKEGLEKIRKKINKIYEYCSQT